MSGPWTLAELRRSWDGQNAWMARRVANAVRERQSRIGTRAWMEANPGRIGVYKRPSGRWSVVISEADVGEFLVGIDWYSWEDARRTAFDEWSKCVRVRSRFWE